MQHSIEFRVMSMVATFIGHSLAVERLTAEGADPEARALAANETMRQQLLHLAGVLEEPDPRGAEFIRWSLTPEGLAELKRMHQQQPPALPWPVSVH